MLCTSQHNQEVLYSLLPSENIPNEIHPWTTQDITVHAGEVEVIINNTVHLILSSERNNFAKIHPNVYHEVRVRGTQTVKLHFTYSPPHHPLNLVQHRQPNERDTE